MHQRAQLWDGSPLRLSAAHQSSRRRQGQRQQHLAHFKPVGVLGSFDFQPGDLRVLLQ